MPRVKQNSMPTSLHYALTDSQCSKCGGQLEWSANFDDINQPKYISQHCDQEYAIRVDSVKVEMMTSVELEDEPGAIRVAKGLKDIKRKN
jgi:NAD-dependent SIR2 family protein deacetylase